ncbi:MAG: DUF5711 family protein [Oscillospiraceae bacterium]|nr:DUF5711 family protein [Oscillospiraceae bacterium]
MKYNMFNGFGLSKPNKSKKEKVKNDIDKRRVIKISIAVFIALLIMVILFIYSNNENFRSFMDTHIFRREVHENNLPEIQIGRNTHVFAHNGNIFTFEQNTLRAFSRNGNEAFSFDIRVTSPIFASNNNFLAVADKDGSNLYLISGRNILHRQTLEGRIDNITVNRNGYVAVARSDASYRAVIELFNRNGNALFRTFLVTSNVIDMAISNDNRYLAIAEANLSGIIIQSNIRVISIENARTNQSEPTVFAHMAEAGDLIIKIKYNNRDNLICMYANRVDSIQNNNTNDKLIDFAYGNVLFVDVNLNAHIAKVVRENTGLFNSDTILQIIDSNNLDRVNTYELPGTPRSVHTYGNMIGVNLGTEVLFINTNGWLVRRYRSSQEVQGVVMCDGIAAIVHRNRLEIVSL